MYILGIWDGHDSGAALINDNKIVYAANEERFTRRKLEVGFPYNSIAASLKYANIKPSDIEHIGFTTTDFAKTLERIFPSMREHYYQLRRRKLKRPMFEDIYRKTKYSVTSIGKLPLCNVISSTNIRSNLKRMGFESAKYKLHIIDHHTGHAATAAFTSNFNRSVVITMDGLGDGLSGSISTLIDGKLERRIAISARDSIGILYEQATTIMGMRELEDEGKVMAMADYSYPFDFEDNELNQFFKVVGTTIKAKYNPSVQYDMLRNIAWHMPREQFAYMVQQLFENILIKFVSNAIDRFNIYNVCFAGGDFANIKTNMRLRGLDNLKKWYVFPHMGDGGMALGSALYTNYIINGTSDYEFSAYLGDEFGEEETLKAIKKYRALIYQQVGDDAGAHAADLVAKGNYLFWFNGRMEYGPRALGNRSIIAPASSEEVKNRLNTYVKNREWFQPFAPSVLEEDFGKIVEYDGKGTDKFMTMAYMIRREAKDDALSVIHVDGSARAQSVGEENKAYKLLLETLKDKTGKGIVLNTSFNLHGYPIVRTPEDAVETMVRTKTKYMLMNGFLVTNRAGI